MKSVMDRDNVILQSYVKQWRHENKGSRSRDLSRPLNFQPLCPVSDVYSYVANLPGMWLLPPTALFLPHRCVGYGCGVSTALL